MKGEKMRETERKEGGTEKRRGEQRRGGGWRGERVRVCSRGRDMAAAAAFKVC